MCGSCMAFVSAFCRTKRMGQQQQRQGQLQTLRELFPGIEDDTMRSTLHHFSGDLDAAAAHLCTAATPHRVEPQPQDDDSHVMFGPQPKRRKPESVPPQQISLCERVQELRHRKNEHATDEWLANNCKLCPYCSNKIDKIEGGDTMKCGFRHRGKKQGPGCGRYFDWSEAQPYSVDAAKAAIMFAFEETRNCSDHEILAGCDLKKVFETDEALLQFRSNSGLEALHLVCMHPTHDIDGNHNACVYLHACGADINKSVSAYGCRSSPLHLAARNGNWGALRALFQLRANVNVQDFLSVTIRSTDLSDLKTLSVCRALCNVGATLDQKVADAMAGIEVSKPDTTKFLLSRFVSS